MTDYKYETRDGKYWAEILRDDLNAACPVVVLLTTKFEGHQHVRMYGRDLTYLCSGENGSDLIPYSPARDWAVDEKIEVSGNGAVWFKAHFAKFKDGYCFTWIGGGTSFTTEDSIPWTYARNWEGEICKPYAKPCK